MKPAVQELLNSIDLEKAGQAIQDAGIQPWDVDSVIDRVMLALDLWLLDDLKAETILVEQEYDLVSKGILDLVLIRDKDGETGIVDWKTLGGSLKRPNYVEETKSEFQASLYLAHGGDWIEKQYGVRPSYLEFRALDEQGEAKSFRVPWTEHCREDADKQVETVGVAYAALLDEPIWPRNRPRACFVGSRGGPTCPFYKDCSEMTMPRGVTRPKGFEVDLQSLVPRSKSSMKSFISCPEQFRRTKMLGGVTKSSDVIVTGEAFHSACEVIYKMILEKR